MKVQVHYDIVGKKKLNPYKEHLDPLDNLGKGSIDPIRFQSCGQLLFYSFWCSVPLAILLINA